MLKQLVSLFRNIGTALLLPIAILPVSGLLLGIGSMEIAWMPSVVSALFKAAGSLVFANIALIFAIGIAVGLTQNSPVAALGAGVGYLIMLSTLGIIASGNGLETRIILGIETLDTGIFGAVLVALLTAYLVQNYSQVKLPFFLSFFSENRFVLVLIVPCAIILGTLLSLIWPPIGAVIERFSHWASYQNPTLAFGIYGWVERALLPIGLHHIWNAPFFFEIGQFVSEKGEVVRGEIPRFIAGDETAGHLAGGYLFKMWGLPAAAIAMWQSSYPENRKISGALLIPAAFTSFITGITVPIEFAFLFVAPVLYVVHIVLAGFAYIICISLEIRHSISFSHGLMDFTLFYHLSENAWLFLVLGPLYALLYYSIFRVFIQALNLKTLGREEAVHTTN